MKLLTICIPTYNRGEHAIRQLEYFRKEINGYEDFTSIIVADNQSEIEHRERLINYHNDNCFFDLKLNDTNLGLVGNLYYLSSMSNSQYIWFVGDDDILLEGLLDKLVPILQQEDNCYVFLNHVGIRNEPDNIVMKMDLSKYETYYRDNCKAIISDIFKKYGGVNMFITANIYPRNYVREIAQCERYPNTADPLLFSFYSAAKSSLYIIKDIYILDQYANISWINESQENRLIHVPTIICELNKFGYDKMEIKQILFFYFNKYKILLSSFYHSNSRLKNDVIHYIGYFGVIKLSITCMYYIIYRKIVNLLKRLKRC
jgi:hypothetical protein